MQRKRIWINLLTVAVGTTALGFFGARFGELAPSGPPISSTLLQGWTAPVPDTGNAFATFWFAGVDVPPESMSEQLADDARQAEERVATARPLLLAPVSRAIPEQRPWPLPNGEATCVFPEMECVAKARALQLPLRAELKLQAPALRAAEALLDANTIQAPAAGYLAVSVQQWPGSTALLNQIALEFAVGDARQAEQTLCRHVQHWRQLRHASPHMTVRTLANTALGDAITLFAEMRAEQPEHAAISPECAAAFGLLHDAEHSLCTLAGGEWRLVTGLLSAGNARPVQGNLLERLRILWRRGAVQPAHASRRLGHYFEQSLCAQPRQSPPALPLQCSLLEHLVDPDGCKVIEQASTLAQQIQASEVNLDWQLRILEIALHWSADPDEASREARIQNVLSAAQLPPETLAFDLDRRAIGLDLMNRHPARWEIFLPGTYAPAEAPAATTAP